MGRMLKPGLRNTDAGPIGPWFRIPATVTPPQPLSTLDPLRPLRPLLFVPVPVTQPIIPILPAIMTPSVWSASGPPLKKIAQAKQGLFSSSALGFPLRTTTPVYNFTIGGITKDSSGNALGGCTVKLYATATDTMLQTVTSDAATGAYLFASVSSQL